ncbi:hypothetical protein AMTRI_Chr04g187910 [Amborella trichopoda]
MLLPWASQLLPTIHQMVLRRVNPLKKDAKRAWMEACQLVLKDPKRAIIRKQMLRLPNFDCLLEIQLYASDHAIGEVHIAIADCKKIGSGPLFHLVVVCLREFGAQDRLNLATQEARLRSQSHTTRVDTYHP